MNKDKQSTKKVGKEDGEQAAARGKKAIDAGKKSMGEDPSKKETKEKEKLDAEAWRSEG